MSRSVWDLAPLLIGIGSLLGHFGVDVAERGFGPGINVQLFEHPLQVRANGFVVHVQFVGDELVGMTFGNEL